MTNTLVEILRDSHGCNVVNFYIIPKLSRMTWLILFLGNQKTELKK